MKRRTLWNAIRNYAAAVEAVSWRSAVHPDERDLLNREEDKSRRWLNGLLDRLTEGERLEP